METVARQDELPILRRILQERLQSEHSSGKRFQVQCLLKQGTLLVLAQHPADPVTNPQPIFKVLQHAILAWQPKLSSQVRLFLRVAGEKQPYAASAFTIGSSNASASSNASVRESGTDANLTVVDTPPSQKQSPDPLEAESALVYLRQPTEITVKQPAVKITDNSLAPIEKPKNRGSLVTYPESTAKQAFPLSLLAAGFGIGIVCFASGFYAFTRPCTIGECPRLQKAEQLSRNATQLVREKTDPQVLQLARTQSIDATNGLEAIPLWSPHRDRARELLQENRDRVRELGLMVTAMDKGMAAALMSQDPPHSVEKWQQVQALWQEAIAPLLAITPDSYIYPLREEKLQEYSSNLAEIKKRIDWEQQAREKLAAAEREADVAIALQGIAQSSEDWQRVQQTWQHAVSALWEVPKGTMAYLEAQQLLVPYQSGQASARSRQTKEEFSANTYHQALYLAEKAKDFEQTNEFSQAVDYWRQALTYARQVPSDTFHHAQTQPLISAYSASLASAEDKFREARNLEIARTELDRACTSLLKICDYHLTEQLIAVQMKRDYMRTVKETFITAGSLGDYNTLIKMDAHLESLRSALEVISNRTGIPLEMYNPNGELMGRYVPTSIN